MLEAAFDRHCRLVFDKSTDNSFIYHIEIYIIMIYNNCLIVGIYLILRQ